MYFIFVVLCQKLYTVIHVIFIKTNLNTTLYLKLSSEVFSDIKKYIILLSCLGFFIFKNLY